MLISRLAFLLFCLFLFAASLLGQPSADSELNRQTAANSTARRGDALGSLKGMTLAQKLQVLDFMRARGADIDREIQQTFEQLPADEQATTRQLFQTMFADSAAPSRSQVEWLVPDTIDIGKIRQDDVYLDSIFVHNVGNAPYIVSDIKTNCDCTVLKKPSQPLMPGEQNLFRLEFDSRGKLGRFLGVIVIYDNSRPNQRKIIYLRGTIVPRR